jgi:hypothetical protein
MAVRGHGGRLQTPVTPSGDISSRGFGSGSDSDYPIITALVITSVIVGRLFIPLGPLLTTGGPLAQITPPTDTLTTDTPPSDGLETGVVSVLSVVSSLNLVIT